MQTFFDPILLQRLRVGPLAPYVDAYLKQIEQEGFSPSSAPMQMYAIARFSKWLHGWQLDLRQVDETTVERFMQRDPGIVHGGESAALRRLLAMLRQIGVTVANCRRNHGIGSSDSRMSIGAIFLKERGLAQATLLNYVPFAEQFLFSRFCNGNLNLSELSAADVTKICPRARPSAG